MNDPSGTYLKHYIDHFDCHASSFDDSICNTTVAIQIVASRPTSTIAV